MKYITEKLSVVVMPEGEPIFSERATRVSIDDEAGGCFVEVQQQGGPEIGKIQIDPQEWPAIKDAIEAMLEVCARIDAAHAQK